MTETAEDNNRGTTTNEQDVMIENCLSVQMKVNCTQIA